MQTESLSVVAGTSLDQGVVVDPYKLPVSTQIALVDSGFTGRVVVQACWRKFARLLSGKLRGIQPVANYNGLVVFDAPGLHGGGLCEGQDFLRTLLRWGIAPCERLFEFCAGPAYVGYYLLANGFCRTLALADINPTAIAAAQTTSRHNRLDHLVSAYVGDVLDGIPADERWEVVVGIPPWSPGAGDVLCHDSGYEVHRRFYAGVKRFMRPGGRVVLMEGSSDSDPSMFEPMVKAGGGRLLGIEPLTTLRGERVNPYFVISQW